MAYYNSVDEKKKEPQQQDSLKMVFLVLIILFSFYFIGYFLGTLIVPKQEKKIMEEVPKNVEYEVDSPKIVNLISRLFSGMNCWVVEDFAKDKMVSVKDLSSERIYEIVHYGSLIPNQVDKITLADFQKEINNYLADGYLFDAENIDYTYLSCYQYQYHEDDQTFYRSEMVCGGVCGPNRTQYKIVKAKEEDDILNVEIRVLFGSQQESTSFYADYNRSQFVTDQVDDLDSYFDQGSLYLFTFKKKDNHYLFVSSTLK